MKASIAALALLLSACAQQQPDPNTSDAHYRCDVEYRKVVAATPRAGVRGAGGTRANFGCDI